MEKSNFRLNFLSQILLFTLGVFLFCNGYAAGNTFIFNPNTLTW
ncbi:TPA: L,D-transpeptidase, partial [Legionella pneumophila subsp. pneumophila]|nr:L,D-transpeptidase [Legionella pneumophila subsp. pneumophila]